jgi:N-acetylglutamate synthase/N-acetylornithine aminotransferase
MRDAVAMADAAANAVGIDPERVLVASTGVIGRTIAPSKNTKGAARPVGCAAPGRL